MRWNGVGWDGMGVWAGSRWMEEDDGRKLDEEVFVVGWLSI